MRRKDRGTPIRTVPVETSTLIRSALVETSQLRDRVKDGLGAMNSSHVRRHVADGIRDAFADSLDLDAALRQGHEKENRWDYLLGHRDSGEVIGLEPHCAKTDEISTIIKKKKAAKEQLKGHLKPRARVTKWLWVASGKVHFADTEKMRLRLDQNGIQFVGKKLLQKHLPAVMPPTNKVYDADCRL